MGLPIQTKAGRRCAPTKASCPTCSGIKGVRTALISDVPLLREAGLGYGRGFDEVIWVRGQGYDPLVPPGDPRARGVRLEDEPGLRLPDDDDETRALWKSSVGAIPAQPGRAPDRPRREHGCRAHRENRDRMARAAASKNQTRSCSGSTFSRRMGRGTLPSRFATST